jgi:murein DD-endopeptidase MepM/ murein hydrolase activator NlpD
MLQRFTNSIVGRRRATSFRSGTVRALLRCAFALSGLSTGAACAVEALAPEPPVLVAEGNPDTPRDEATPAQEQRLWDEIRRSVATLRAKSLLAVDRRTQAVTYGFPLRLAPGLPDYAGFRVSAFSDHNAAAGSTQVLDYNGGNRTYDGHRGTDYALSPFGWNKVDAGDMQVVAAAAGTIAYKANVDPTDHNCNVASADPWNYIGIVHADGRLTLYGHMRYNSLTTKGIGEAVAQGEYLGTAASSGNSSGPHLHFEARYGSFSNNEWIDPYAGPASQPESSWTSQRPYVDSAINRLATHSSPPSTPDPCAPSILNLQDSFSTGQNIYFYAYYHDYQGSLITQATLYRPDGTLQQSWQYSSATAFSSSWNASWVSNLPVWFAGGHVALPGCVQRPGYETFFNVDAPTTIAVVSPNGGEQWDVSLAHAVTWADNLGGEVNIDLYRNNVFVARLASNTASDGSYTWTPDAALAPARDTPCGFRA